MNTTGTSTEYKAEDDFQLIEDAILGVAGARNALTRRVQELSPRAAEAVTNMFNQGLEDARNNIKQAGLQKPTFRVDTLSLHV